MRVYIPVKYLQILLFPEGTDKCDWTTKKSAEYATANGMQPFKWDSLCFLLLMIVFSSLYNKIYDSVVIICIVKKVNELHGAE